MCIDNDAMLDENAVGNLFEFLEEHDEVGMAASKIYHLEAPDYIQQFGQKIDFEYFCTEVPHLNMLEDGSMPDYLYVDSVPACSLMIRRTTVDKIGLMPEENFIYWDDTEWCYLCNRAGMKVASVGTSKALHAMGAKREDVNTFPTYYAWRNWISFFARYTPVDRLEKMVETFLGSIFAVTYAGLHKGEYNRMKTVMLAYDDAIHGVTGKAGENRIFEIDINYEPFIKLFKSAKCFYVEEHEFPILADWLKKLSGQLGMNVKWSDKPGSGVKTISLCECIFRIDDLSLSKVYIDIDKCILRDEDDVLDVINYNYSKRSFIAAQKPLFLQKIRETFVRVDK
jgi:GT2 family glycosyltransferase